MNLFEKLFAFWRPKNWCICVKLGALVTTRKAWQKSLLTRGTWCLRGLRSQSKVVDDSRFASTRIYWRQARNSNDDQADLGRIRLILAKLSVKRLLCSNTTLHLHSSSDILFMDHKCDENWRSLVEEGANDPSLILHVSNDQEDASM